MTDQTTTNAPVIHAEAPASWNVKYILNGYDCMLTVRGESGAELLPKTLKALEWLTANGAEPTRVSAATFAANGAGNGAASKPAEPPKLADGAVDPTWCAIHGVAMKRHEKDNQVWYSHKVGDSYCKGK